MCAEVISRVTSRSIWVPSKMPTQKFERFRVCARSRTNTSSENTCGKFHCFTKLVHYHQSPSGHTSLTVLHTVAVSTIRRPVIVKMLYSDGNYASVYRSFPQFIQVNIGKKTKFSRADSHVKMWRFSDVSGINSIPIFRVCTCWRWGRS
jgi:hypothetical protein